MNPRFDEISRKAAAGTLTADERAWLDAFLREHPDRRSDVEWDAALARQLEAKVAAMPALPGWERTERVLKEEGVVAGAAPPGEGARPHEATHVPRPRAAASRAPGVLDRVSDWFASLGLAFNAQAIAAALVVVQAGVIGWLASQANDTDEGAIRAGVEDPSPRGPLLRVSFREDVREGDLRRALATVGGEIVGGPGQVGVYVVRIKDGDIAGAARRLRDSGTTVLVEVVEARR